MSPSEPVRPSVAAHALRRTGDSNTQRPYQLFALTPYSPTIGAEIDGVDLAAPLKDDVLADLKRALLEWKVLFFRDQHLDAASHTAFARHWGVPEVHPFLPKAALPEVVRLAHDHEHPGVENVWHSDVSFDPTPPLGSVLRAVELPEVGGDTLWADMAAAYDGLPSKVKNRLHGLRAVHDFLRSFGHLMPSEERERQRVLHPPVEHPVVRTHPETGRQLIYVNRVFTDHLVGLPENESTDLLNLLYEQARHPEYQCRFRWTPNAIAFWDNRITQHYAVSDYYPAPRVMERVTIIGDRPR
jgi:taurine dioxygenase